MSSHSTPSLNHRKLISGALTRTRLRTELYRYDKLEGRNEIRLLVLPPGSFYSSVRCDIIHVDLAEAPDYEALSYTWADQNGDKSLTGAISCGSEDKRIPITRNCEAALRHLRLEKETRVLWIDAICINQSTIEERNHQVSIMSKIYSTASRVVVYLGEADRDSDQFINFLNNKIEAELSRIQIRQANSLFCRGWFQRLWVFQEVMLARRVVVMCGDKTVPWRALVKFYNAYSYCMYNFDDGELDNASFAKILFRYGVTGPQAVETLPELFRAAQQGKASDPRDKVFALLGIVEKDSHAQMVPDYGLSTEKTFENLATYFIRRFGIVFPRSDLRSCSWVFDWLHHTPQHPIHVGDEVTLQDTEEGGKGLVIRGQRMISGFANLHHQRMWDGIWCKWHCIEGGSMEGDSAIVGSNDWYRYLTGEFLVRVSDRYCVLMRMRDGLYELIGEAGALRKCKSHVSDSQCGPSCLHREIALGNSEKFAII